MTGDQDMIKAQLIATDNDKEKSVLKLELMSGTAENRHSRGGFRDRGCATVDNNSF